MSWLRSGDNAPYDPRILATQAMPEADGPWFLNEVRGFIWTLSSTSAGFLTDYVLNMGVVYQAAGSAERAERLVTVCCRAGLMERVDVDGMPGVKLVEDPDFVHIRKKDEVEWDRQRKRDNSDPNPKGPVLLRDGDWCRYCRHEVHWTGRMSNRKATLDHLSPGTPGTVDTLVVACVTCNSARQDDEDGEWTRAHPLLPPPKRPVYGPWTRHYLTNRGLLRPAAAVESKSPSQGKDVVNPGAAAGSASEGRSPVVVNPGAAAGSASEGRSPVVVNPGAAAGSASEGRSHSCDESPPSPAVSRPGSGRPLGWGAPRVRPESAPSPRLSSNSVRTPALRSPESPGRDGTDSGREPGRDEPGRARARDGPGRGCASSGMVRSGGRSVRKRRRKR